MSFNLNFPTTEANTSDRIFELGEVLFILGSNGTGKSSLLQRFNNQNDSSLWITAHRQNWLPGDASSMTSARKIEMENHFRSHDKFRQARYRDESATERINIVIHNLISAEHLRDRKITAKVDERDMGKARKLSDILPAPINIINDIFQRSNLSIRLGIGDGERLIVHKGEAGAEYGASQMSDGERNALLIAANVLTAPECTLLLIDEPERHLHRSIAAPLLFHLFEKRKDCGFIISTHDIELPMTKPKARVLLLRECLFQQKNNPQRWVTDELEPGATINEDLKRNVLGSRRKILFVEGNNDSLDKKLYGCVFPFVSVIPKSGCNEVEQAVTGHKLSEELHWLKIFGIVDGDGRDDHEIAENKQGVYTLPYYSIEAIYYHPNIIRKIAARKAQELGKKEDTLYNNALGAGIAAVDKKKDYLSKNKAKREARRMIDAQLQLSNDDDLLDDFSETIAVNGSEIHKQVKNDLEDAVKGGEWEKILKICPIRKSGARKDIATTLHYRNSEDYESAVIEMLRQDEEAANFVRELLGDLAEKLSDSAAQPPENAS